MQGIDCLLTDGGFQLARLSGSQFLNGATSFALPLCAMLKFRLLSTVERDIEQAILAILWISAARCDDLGMDLAKNVAGVQA